MEYPPMKGGGVRGPTRGKFYITMYTNNAFLSYSGIISNIVLQIYIYIPSYFSYKYTRLQSTGLPSEIWQTVKCSRPTYWTLEHIMFKHQILKKWVSCDRTVHIATIQNRWLKERCTINLQIIFNSTVICKKSCVSSTVNELFLKLRLEK